MINILIDVFRALTIRNGATGNRILKFESSGSHCSILIAWYLHYNAFISASSIGRVTVGTDEALK